jgi:hypothetical protein
MIKEDETRAVEFVQNIQSGDTIEVNLGYFLVNPKVLKRLNLQDEKELTKFIILKKSVFYCIF